MKASIVLTLSALLLATAVLLPARAGGNVCVYKPPKVRHIRGSIMDGAGWPIPDAQVAVMQAGATLQTFTTNKTGEFSFDSLKDGVYEVEAQARGFQRARYAVRLSSRKNPNQILRITLGIGSMQCTGSIEVLQEKPAPHD